ncbi:hypothetical protein [Sedimenticola hydrogenitrophicus]|jgi:hypothetical protein|nr:hypothetical protein [Sedimenticola hydrogenitrophicus]
MIFDNLTFAALALFVLISAFLIGTKNRSRREDNKSCQDPAEKHTEQ